MINPLKKSLGIAALPLVLMIGGLVIEITVAGVIVGYAFANSGLSMRLSTEALSAAKAGVEDGVYRVVRNSYTATDPYTINVVNSDNPDMVRTATIKIYENRTDCSTVWPCRYTICSVGSALNRSRQMVALLVTDPDTRAVKVRSLREMPMGDATCNPD